MLVVALLAHGGLGACTHTCTDIGCETGLSLAMQLASGSWADGEYVLDAGPAGCTFSIPRDLPTGGSTRLTCNGATRVQLGKAGLQLWLSTTPSNLAVVLTRDGTPILQENSTPSYQDSMPNGPDCGPSCRSASVDLTVTQ